MAGSAVPAPRLYPTACKVGTVGDAARDSSCSPKCAISARLEAGGAEIPPQRTQTRRALGTPEIALARLRNNQGRGVSESASIESISDERSGCHSGTLQLDPISGEAAHFDCGQADDRARVGTRAQREPGFQSRRGD